MPEPKKDSIVFTIQHLVTAPTGSGRLGRLELGLSTPPLHTPALLFATDCGAIPHLTTDNYTHLLDHSCPEGSATMALSLGLESFIPLLQSTSSSAAATTTASSTSSATKSKIKTNALNFTWPGSEGLRSFLGLGRTSANGTPNTIPSTLLFADLCHSHQLYTPGSIDRKGSNAHVTATTPNGTAVPVTPEMYHDLVKLCQPDLVVCEWAGIPASTATVVDAPSIEDLCDEDSDIKPSRHASKAIKPVPIFGKTASKQVTRNLTFLRRFRALNTNDNVLGVVTGGDVVSERIKSAQETAAITPALFGFVIPLQSDELLPMHDSNAAESDTQAMNTAKSNHLSLEEKISISLQHLPSDKLKVCYGLSDPRDIIRAIDLGIDLFDASLPVFLADQGIAMILTFAFNSTSKCGMTFLDLKEKVYFGQQYAIDSQCGCHACATYSRAYIHHLFEMELLGYTLIALHNHYQISRWFADIRASLADGSWAEKSAAFLAS